MCLNLAYGCLCRLDLSDQVAHHSTLAKNRHGRFHDCDVFRRLFEAVLAQCLREGLVGGEAFSVDASLIRADANSEDGIVPAQWSPQMHVSLAAAEYLEELDATDFGAATDVDPR